MKWVLFFVGLIGISISCRWLSLPENDDETNSESSGLEGTVKMESDVMFQRNIQLADQLVLVFPEEAKSSLFGDQVDTSQLRFLRLPISEESEYTTTTITDNKGYFYFYLPPGEYVLCLADSDSQDSTRFPLTTRGCAQVSVHLNIMRRIEVSSGFGEILLKEQ